MGKLVYVILVFVLCFGFISGEEGPCFDTDGGLSYFEKGSVSFGGFYEDSCIGGILEEYFCSNEGHLGILHFNCSRGCYDGACLMEPVLLESPSCFDTDGGLDYFLKGDLFINSEYQATDSCEGPILKEHYCEVDQSKTAFFECSNGCKDGACLGRKETFLERFVGFFSEIF